MGSITLPHAATVPAIITDGDLWRWYVSNMLITGTDGALKPYLAVGQQFTVDDGTASGVVEVAWEDDAGFQANTWGFTLTDISGTMWATTLRTSTNPTIWTAPEIVDPRPVMDAFDLQDLIDDGKIVTAEPSRRQFITSVQATPGAAGSKATTISFTPAQIPGTLHDVNWGDGTEEVVDYDGKQHVYANAGTYRVTVYPYGSTNHNVYVDTTVS